MVPYIIWALAITIAITAAVVRAIQLREDPHIFGTDLDEHPPVAQRKRASNRYSSSSDFALRSAMKAAASERRRRLSLLRMLDT